MSEKKSEAEPDARDETLAPEDEDRIVDKVVDRVKAVLTDLVGKPKAEVEGEGEAEVEVEAKKEPSTVKEIETDMEAQVRKQLAKIMADEEHAKDHEKLKKEPERPPVTVGKVTRFLWGGGD